MALSASQKNAVRRIISDILEIESEDLTETSLFVEDYEADSLRFIEILANLEKEFKVEIPDNKLNRMVNLSSVCDVLEEHLKA